VRRDGPSNPNAVDGLEAVRLIEAVAASSASGDTVML
jgi:hypothetical protein